MNGVVTVGSTRHLVRARLARLVLAVVLLVSMWPSVSRASVAASPAAIVTAYVAALNRHDAANVCSVFASQLRRYEATWDAPPDGRHTCRAAVAAHFHSYYSRHRWAGAYLRGVMRTTIDPRTGFAAVRFVLVYRHVCVRDGSSEACHPGNYARPERIYLLYAENRWQILKPGVVYRATEIDQPLDAESNYYPPGNAATIAGPVSLPSRSRPCPATRAVTRSPRHSLQSTFEPNPNGSPGNVPGLTIRAFSVARISRTTACFTFTLAGPPRPDFGYQVFVGTLQQAAAAELYDIEIDGLGQPHALLAGLGALSTPWLAHDLPSVYASGNQLEIIGTDRTFALRKFIVEAGTESIQDDEPLLTGPLDAGDFAALRGCLVVPTGTLNTRGLCGSVPGP